MEPLISSEEVSIDFEETINNGPFPIRFPKKKLVLEQDQEWCEVKIDGQWKRIRFHDYHEVYPVPGLYETIFYRTLRCNSPNRMAQMLNEVLVERNVNPNDLRVLDLGAGNGMAGEALQNIGARKIVGIDLLEEAKDAALRDRPWVYDHYFASDLTQLSPEVDTFLQDYKFNTLCTVAALGFGDIPVQVFAKAFNYVSDGGLLIMNIKEDFLKRHPSNHFGLFIDKLVNDEILEIELFKRYSHRLNIHGQPLYYVGLVGIKRGDIKI